MISPIINFSLRIIVILGIVFGVHLALLHYLKLPLFENFILQAYLINIFLAILIYTFLYILKNKYLDLLGFIFMAGSLLKFLFFFIFFYPIYRFDGQVVRLEAMSFLTPYLTCLVVETYYLVKLLNKD